MRLVYCEPIFTSAIASVSHVFVLFVSFSVKNINKTKSERQQVQQHKNKTKYITITTERQ